MAPTRLIALALLGTAFTTALAGPVQNPDLALPPDAADHRQAVLDIFTKSYSAYKKYAWGHDDLAPISRGFVDSRNGWGASIVDALSTMHIMGLKDLFEEGVAFSSNIDFSTSKTPSTVSVFETTIRFLGGLLSAYELSEGKYPALLQKAQEVADKMAYAWVGGNDVPYGFLNFTSNTPRIATSNIAEAGTLILEWSTLAKHTGNDTYRDLAERSFRRIATNGAPLPGLAAQGIDPSTGRPVGGYVTWGGGSDSYFEYLIKYSRLNTTCDPLYTDSWRTAVDSSLKTLLKRSTVGNWAYLADYDSSRRIRFVSSHLACFHGGNWLFGGRLLNNQTIIDTALELIDACWNTYPGTATGIGPEGFAFISEEGEYTGGSPPTAAQRAFYNRTGYYITSSYYILRPEVLESNFYAWRVTGDTKYLDRAASAIDSINKYLTVNEAYSGIWDVNNVNSDKIDDMESFWFAEVLKYLYLTFDDPSHISLDEWVFNTEAHPIKLPPAKDFYGTGTWTPHTAPFTPVMPGPLPAVSGITDLQHIMDSLLG
ncbi:hypothetical protein AX16_002605 [Volvariella volvacea WC 439]|nr:hypothetical protein AX16_002605 [Volvariella volvacea WC 439]